MTGQQILSAGKSCGLGRSFSGNFSEAGGSGDALSGGLGNSATMSAGRGPA